MIGSFRGEGGRFLFAEGLESHLVIDHDRNKDMRTGTTKGCSWICSIVVGVREVD